MIVKIGKIRKPPRFGGFCIALKTACGKLARNCADLVKGSGGRAVDL